MSLRGLQRACDCALRVLRLRVLPGRSRAESLLTARYGHNLARRRSGIGVPDHPYGPGWVGSPGQPIPPDSQEFATGGLVKGPIDILIDDSYVIPGVMFSDGQVKPLEVYISAPLEDLLDGIPSSHGESSEGSQEGSGGAQRPSQNKQEEEPCRRQESRLEEMG